MAPAIGGVLETCLYVEDMARARRFYEDVLGFRTMLADNRLTVYDAGPASALLLFKRGATTEPVYTRGGTIPPHNGSGALHIALAIPAESLEAWRRHLVDRGVGLESEVRWPAGGISLYFRDPDHQLVELATPGLWPNYPTRSPAVAAPRS